MKKIGIVGLGMLGHAVAKHLVDMESNEIIIKSIYLIHSKS